MCNFIKGKADIALRDLDFTEKKLQRMGKTVKSAISNAENNNSTISIIYLLKRHM